MAIVTDNLTQRGGMERVVEVFHQIFPAAPIFTSVYNESKVYPSFKEMDIRTSFVQKLPFSKKYFRQYFMLYSNAFRRFDLRNYDVIVSFSHAFAKGIKRDARTCHICYCFTPMRFVWNYQDYMKREKLGSFVGRLLHPFISRLRTWDVETATGVDYFIASCDNVENKIKEIYERDSTVIHPPVDTSFFTPSKEAEDYFLVVSRLVPYKRMDIAVEAFNILGYPLKVVGEGRDRRRLEKMANKNVEFLGYVSDNKLKDYYAGCRGLIFPGEEDFGLAPLEAQSCGRPVIAYGGGGALETVVDGITGKFFYEQTAQGLIKAIKEFDGCKFNSKEIREHALKFDIGVFKREITAFIRRKFEGYQKRKG